MSVICIKELVSKSYGSEYQWILCSAKMKVIRYLFTENIVEESECIFALEKEYLSISKSENKHPLNGLLC